MEKRCDNYVGFACVDGSCPVANYRYFMDEGMPDLAKAFADAGNCNSCAYYRGCEDCKSVKWLLLSLNLCDYTRVYIREHGSQGINYVGGGYPGKVMQRFGNRLVIDSAIYEGSLILYVQPDLLLSDHWGDYCNIGRTDGGVHVCSCIRSCSSCSDADGVSCPMERSEL